MPKTPPNAAAVTEKTTVDMQTAEKSARIPTKHDMTYSIKKYKMPVKNPNIRPRILLSFALINPPIQLLKIVIATTDEEHIFSEVDHKREILAKISIIITLMKSAIIADSITFLADFKLKISLKTKPPLNIMFVPLYSKRDLFIPKLFFGFFFGFVIGIFYRTFATITFFDNGFNGSD